MTDEAKREDALDDDALVSLFSAFDDIRAPSDLEDATIARILAMASEPDADSVADENSGTTVGDEADSGGKAPVIKVVSAGPSRQESHKKRWKRGRIIRVAAIAACLAFALTGGLAYATPTAHVQVNEGGALIDIGVNCFGIAISAESDDADIQQQVNDAALCNKPYREALDGALSLLEDGDASSTPHVTVDTKDPSQKSKLEEETASAVKAAEEREAAAANESTTHSAQNNGNEHADRNVKSEQSEESVESSQGRQRNQDDSGDRDGLSSQGSRGAQSSQSSRPNRGDSQGSQGSQNSKGSQGSQGSKSSQPSRNGGQDSQQNQDGSQNSRGAEDSKNSQGSQGSQGSQPNQDGGQGSQEPQNSQSGQSDGKTTDGLGSGTSQSKASEPNSQGNSSGSSAPQSESQPKTPQEDERAGDEPQLKEDSRA